MKSSLPDKIRHSLLNEISKHPEIKKVILFGSRARGDYRPNSDIDLAIYYEGKLPSGLYSDLDEAAGIYKIDVVYMQNITNKKLQSNIDHEGITIYTPRETISR